MDCISSSTSVCKFPLHRLLLLDCLRSQSRVDLSFLSLYKKWVGAIQFDTRILQPYNFVYTWLKHRVVILIWWHFLVERIGLNDETKNRGWEDIEEYETKKAVGLNGLEALTGDWCILVNRCIQHWWKNTLVIIYENKGDAWKCWKGKAYELYHEIVENLSNIGSIWENQSKCIWGKQEECLVALAQWHLL